MKKNTLLLELKGAIDKNILDKDLRAGLSAVARTGRYLWVAGDEQISIQRLEKSPEGGYGKAVSFHLGDYVELISTKDEMDVEGMDYDGRYLWIIGSHSLKRSNIKDKTNNPAKEINKLSKVNSDPNRILLLRIPCLPNEEGVYTLHQSCADPDNPGQLLQAAKLKHGKKNSQLSKVLKKDQHLKAFMKIPGKDNGFDIEGLAAYRDRLFIGLRGPVLRGWAILLEVRLELNSKGLLKLRLLNSRRDRYFKYFVNLNGMGIRELAVDEKGLLILAGPTMDLDGTMAVYRWHNVLEAQEDHLISRDDLEELVTLPYNNTTHGINKAEGMVVLENGALVVVYDSPGPERCQGEHGVLADVFELD